jgi:hypothetical protein
MGDMFILSLNSVIDVTTLICKERQREREREREREGESLLSYLLHTTRGRSLALIATFSNLLG